MITLEVADYCHECPGFEPELDRDYRVTHSWTPDGREIEKRRTAVRCKYRGRCEAIHNHIQKMFEKECKE